MGYLLRYEITDHEFGNIHVTDNLETHLGLSVSIHQATTRIQVMALL